MKQRKIPFFRFSGRCVRFDALKCDQVLLAPTVSGANRRFRRRSKRSFKILSDSSREEQLELNLNFEIQNHHQLTFL